MDRWFAKVTQEKKKTENVDCYVKKTQELL